MSDSLKQNQKAGDHSTNVQAGRIEIHQHGLTVPDVRQICLDLFEANFYKLQSVARETAENRAREITERFVQELHARNPAGLESAADPDMQAAIFTAQRDYARFGTEHLEDLLVELLVERSSVSDLRQIVLNEAIAAASKLTTEHLDLLSLTLLLGHQPPLRYRFDSEADFATYTKRYIAPLIHTDMEYFTGYLHVKSIGCATTDLGQAPIAERFRLLFPACFMQGFDSNQLDIESRHMERLVIPYFHHPEGWQFRPMDADTFKETCQELGIPDDKVAGLLLRHHVMPVGSSIAAEMVAGFDPRFPVLFSPYEGIASALTLLQLTTTGLALANVNLRRRVGLEFDLGYWIK